MTTTTFFQHYGLES